MTEDKFYKNNKSDSVWWVATDAVGEFLFTFDKNKIYNLYEDYPHNLTPEQLRLFDKENPLWADYFSDRRSEK